MNNDISDVNNFAKTTNRSRKMTSAENNAAQPSEETINQNQNPESMASSMDYLGTMGYAQVNMNNPLGRRVKSSVESYTNDPMFAGAHVDLCDELVQKGYSLEKAIDTTDKFFNTLKKEDTYK